MKSKMSQHIPQKEAEESRIKRRQSISRETSRMSDWVSLSSAINSNFSFQKGFRLLSRILV